MRSMVVFDFSGYLGRAQNFGKESKEGRESSGARTSELTVERA